jgi:alkanesulfonate monooxygenase SsuD/methylene tetrahydromethanopterin reductase-like flavin-dependent oxidoreductase (luciferase family)
MTSAISPVGLVLGSLLPPEELRDAARAGEALGFGQLWMAEDCFFAGAISGAAVVLGATERIPVGLGIVNAMVRHPALLAMELATLGRTHPDRLVPAIGLGLPDWLRQLGVHPRSPLAAMRECVSSVRRLLAGEEVDAVGASFRFDHVQLSFPVAMPLHMGIMGPRMLELSGEISDGTVLSVLASPRYVEWAREHIAAGAARGGRSEPHRVSTFTLFAVDADGERAREQLRPFLAFFLETVSRSTLVTALGIADELRDLIAAGPGVLAREMPEIWIEDLAVAGDPDECAGKIRRLLEAGSDTVELFPAPPERAGEFIALAAEQVLPLVGTRGS